MKTVLIGLFLVGLSWSVKTSQEKPRIRRALHSRPSGPEEVKRVVRIETFYSADRVTG